MPELSKLTDRDGEIIEHVRRYRLTTIQVLKHVLFSEAADLTPVVKVVGRLKLGGWLREARLYDRHKYYLLTSRAARHLGEDEGISKPFKHQGLTNAYGVLWFCAKLGVNRFTYREFVEQFPTLHERGLQSSTYYIDTSQGRKRLGYIHVDGGNGADRVLSRVNRIVARRYLVNDFRKLIQEGGFVVAVATPSQGKKLAIEEALRQGPTPEVRYRVVAVEELAPVLMNIQPRPARDPAAGPGREAE